MRLDVILDRVLIRYICVDIIIELKTYHIYKAILLII
jgi:hypothetical protein